MLSYAHQPAGTQYASAGPNFIRRSAVGRCRIRNDDLARLKRLPANETHLALVKEHYANVRANVWFHGLDARSRGRVMVSAELPLLYPLGRSKEIPEIKYPPEDKDDAEDGSAVPARERSAFV